MKCSHFSGALGTYVAPSCCEGMKLLLISFIKVPIVYFANIPSVFLLSELGTVFSAIFSFFFGKCCVFLPCYRSLFWSREVVSRLEPVCLNENILRISSVFAT